MLPATIEEPSLRRVLRQHAGICVRAGNALVRVFEEPHEEDEALRDLHALAERGDVLLRETLLQLMELRSAPLEHADVQETILALDTMLDRIVLVAERAAELSVRRRQSTAIALAKLVEGCCRQFHLVMLQANPELRVLVDLGVLVGTAEVLHRRGSAEVARLREPDVWKAVFSAFKDAVRAADQVSVLVEATILRA